MNELENLGHIILTLTICTPRLMVMFAVLPFMSSGIIYGPMRNGIALVLLMIAYPIVAPTVGQGVESFSALAFILVKEAVLGLLLGFVASIGFWVALGAGQLMDYQRGTGMGSLIDPMSGVSSSPLSSLLFQFITVLFFSTGGFLSLLGLFFASYAFWPVMTFMPRLPPEFPVFFLGQMDIILLHTVLVASPVFIVCLLMDLGLGLMNRFAPQLNVFSLSMPLKSGMALFVLIVSVSMLSVVFKERFLEIDKTIAFLRGMLS